jgi:hypothetical protein
MKERKKEQKRKEEGKKKNARITPIFSTEQSNPYLLCSLGYVPLLLHALTVFNFQPWLLPSLKYLALDTKF